jgi:quinol monooxygenase YgiN
MFTPGHYVTAELRTKDVHRIAETKEALGELCAATLGESGCSLFVAHHDPLTPTRFLLWERWDDEAALKRHFTLPHTLAYIERNLTEVVHVFQTDVVAVA